MMILSRVTIETYRTNQIRFEIKGIIVVRDLLKMFNISCRSSYYLDVIIHSLYALCFWSTAAKPLVHENPFQVANSALPIKPNRCTQLVQQSPHSSQQTRRGLTTTVLQPGFGFQKFEPMLMDEPLFHLGNF